MLTSKFNTTYFFDRSIIKKRWGRINESPIKKAGLLVRKIARNSIRRDNSKAQRPSKAGKPPKSRAAGAPIKMIFSVPNALATSALIGFLGFGSKSGVPTPALHEHGGTAIRMVKTKSRVQGRSTKGRFKKKKTDLERRTVTYSKRPTMGPALYKAKDKLPELWKGSIK